MRTCNRLYQSGFTTSKFGYKDPAVKVLQYILDALYLSAWVWFLVITYHVTMTLLFFFFFLSSLNMTRTQQKPSFTSIYNTKSTFRTVTIRSMKYGNDTDYTAVDLYTGIELIMVYYREKSNRNNYPAFMRNQFCNASYSTVTEYHYFLFSNDYNPTSIATKTLTL